MEQENLIRIPFSEKEYYVTPQGEIISNVYRKMNKLKGRPFLDTRIRTFDVVSNTSKKVTIYSHRILFFCYIYPLILKKNTSSMTLQEYRDMGDIVLKNNRKRVSLSNILIVPKQNKVGERIKKKFPHLVKDLKGKNLIIIGKDLTKVKKYLKQERSYPWIAKNLSIDVHPQAIYRVRKRLSLPTRVSYKMLSKNDRLKIIDLSAEFSGAELAKRYNVSPTTISRILNGRVQ